MNSKETHSLQEGKFHWKQKKAPKQAKFMYQQKKKEATSTECA